MHNLQDILMNWVWFRSGITGIGGATLVGVDLSTLLPILGSIPFIGHVSKFAVAFPLSYHYLGGLRHLLWDKLPEQLLTNDRVDQSSKLLVATSVTISAVLAFI